MKDVVVNPEVFWSCPLSELRASLSLFVHPRLEFFFLGEGSPVIFLSRVRRRFCGIICGCEFFIFCDW